MSHGLLPNSWCKSAEAKARNVKPKAPCPLCFLPNFQYPIREQFYLIYTVLSYKFSVFINALTISGNLSVGTSKLRTGTWHTCIHEHSCWFQFHFSCAWNETQLGGREGRRRRVFKLEEDVSGSCLCSGRDECRSYHLKEQVRSLWFKRFCTIGCILCTHITVI